MNKALLTISAVALSSSSAMAYETDVEINSSYMKLASISPIVESDHNMVINQNFDLSIPLDPDNPTDPDHPINESCIARGFDVVDGCDATGDCIPEYCPENPLYMACTCFCAVNACTTQGYFEQTCDKYQIEEDCPMLPKQGYVKCTDMEGFEKCIVDEYYDSAANCTGYKIAEECPFDSGYEKCVDMTDEEKCITDGYDIESCPAGEEVSEKCPHGDEDLYKKCVVADCGSEFVTSCSTGYKLDTSNSCTDSSGTKYLCVAEECVGYDQTSPCGAGYSESTCLSGTTTKYMCNPNDCTGYDQTSPCSPADGYVQETCQAGSTTKYKCTPNICKGYSTESCATPIDTCKSGTVMYYLGCDGGGEELPDTCQPDGNTWCVDNGYTLMGGDHCLVGQTEVACPCTNTKGYMKCGGDADKTHICETKGYVLHQDGLECAPGYVFKYCPDDSAYRTCVEEDYTCSAGYFKDYNPDLHCHVTPSKIVTEPGKPDCKKCECDTTQKDPETGTYLPCAFI